MTNSKTTKRALFSSVMALLLCFTMLLGTTFAWFTDSAASGSNVITAGNLDIEVQYTLGDKNDAGELIWKDLDGATDLFRKGLWEPGHTEVVLLKITNNGSLALKYAANMNIVSETVGKTKDNKDIVLSEILTVSTCTQQYTDGNGIIASGADIFPAMTFNSDGGVDGWIGYQTTSSFKDGNVLKNDKQLQPKESDYIAVKVDMAETVGNEANHNGTNIPTINFGINVLATQFTYENDSFGNQYDKDAEYKEPATRIATFDELKTAFANGGNVELTADIAITELVTIPAGVEVYLDMNGKTITPASANVDPLFDVKTGAALVIDGNGTFDLGEMGTVNGMSLMYPRGDVTINSGTFKIATNGTKYGSMFVGISGGQGKLIINGGYFDGGYYKEGDCFNNCRNLINGSWGQYIRVYGGTFVGQNPAWGDEGMAFLCPHCTHTPGQGYCQALFLEGQSREDTELPAGYTITEGTTADGRPTYTVNYSK